MNGCTVRLVNKKEKSEQKMTSLSAIVFVLLLPYYASLQLSMVNKKVAILGSTGNRVFKYW